MSESRQEGNTEAPGVEENEVRVKRARTYEYSLLVT